MEWWQIFLLILSPFVLAFLIGILRGLLDRFGVRKLE